MTVVVLDEQDDPLPSTDQLFELAGVVLAGEGLPEATEVAISLIDEPRIQELNESHLGKQGPTDVLSFPLEDLRPGHGLEPSVPGGPPPAIGDVFICPAYVRKRARAAGVAFDDEMALMVVHGLLHLLGYDHVKDSDAVLMEAQERRYLAQVGRQRP
ncbi:MAG TPA: rRNA maturation RNase YbeY [Acidimicrobiia bacterium]|nr:rRNA maturation RNase YbeY [Acidimicrobiia bacterium]